MAEKKEHPFAHALRWVANGYSVQVAVGAGAFFADCSSKEVLRVIMNYAPDKVIFRIKPRTIKIGAHDVPEPMRIAPKKGTEYFAIRFFDSEGSIDEVWTGTKEDFAILKNGGCWLKREDAELATKAIRELLTGAAK